MKEKRKEYNGFKKKFLQKLHYYVSLHNTVVFCKKKKKAIIHHRLGVFFREYLLQYSRF